MKKLISLVISVLLAVSFCGVAFAQGSPSGSTKHKVTVVTSFDGKSTVASVDDGDTYTLNAKTVSGYNFVKWNLSGSYTIVSGDASSATLVIKPTGDVTATAVYNAIQHKVTIKENGSTSSEEIDYIDNGKTIKLTASVDSNKKFVRWEISGKYEIVSGSLDSATLVIKPLGDVVINKVATSSSKDEYTVTVNRGSGDKEIQYNVVKNGDTYTLTASTPDKGYKFARWSITGDYEIVSGSLTSEKLVIKPLGDVTVKEVFEKISKGGTNNSDKSPKTGDAIPSVLLAVFMTSLAACAVSKKLAK